ncbi:MAG: DUF1501 domain-containing protein, partial [Phycisphaerales bacterium]|nr:DUF1501 domain-containing protein [Phycisphaerales bacterium]
MDRRAFMQTTALLATGATLPGFLGATARAARASRDERILVVLQLTGGNDGLNTVIPYEDDLYHKSRPTLRVDPSRALKLGQGLGLHPNMVELKALYDEGLVNVINNVGYPNPDRSHFRSMDIWHTGRLRPEDVEEGWLGRVIDGTPPGGSPTALHLDDSALPLALRASSRPVPSIRDIDAFRLRHHDEALDRALRTPRQGDDLMYVQRLAIESCANARRIESVHASNEGDWPDHDLGRRLRQIADLISSDFGPRVYYTSIGGFDTHARQAMTHPRLVAEVSSGLGAFMRAMQARGLSDRVLVMTFSEFGRRVKEN